jgi:hypothetical protein
MSPDDLATLAAALWARFATPLRARAGAAALSLPPAPGRSLTDRTHSFGPDQAPTRLLYGAPATRLYRKPFE